MSKLSKVLRILVTGSVSMLLSACYGVVAGMDPSLLIRLKTVDTNGEAIPKLNISYKNSSNAVNWEFIGSTDEFGEIAIDELTYLDSDTKLKIEDIDGVENLGDFETKTLSPQEVNNNTVEMIKN